MPTSYTTKGETISESGYGKEEVAGKYYFINQRRKNNVEIIEAEIVSLKENGAVSGIWRMKDGTYYISLT